MSCMGESTLYSNILLSSENNDVLMIVGPFGTGTFLTQTFRTGRFGLERLVLVFFSKYDDSELPLLWVKKALYPLV